MKLEPESEPVFFNRLRPKSTPAPQHCCTRAETVMQDKEDPPGREPGEAEQLLLASRHGRQPSPGSIPADRDYCRVKTSILDPYSFYPDPVQA